MELFTIFGSFRMIRSSRPFSTLKELNENVENNNATGATASSRRTSVDSDVYKPTAGHTLKLDGVGFVRYALRHQEFQIAKLHFDNGVAMDEIPRRFRLRASVPPRLIKVVEVVHQGQLEH